MKKKILFDEESISLNMKKSLYLLFLLVGPLIAIGQQSINLDLKELQKVNCDCVNEKSSSKKQLKCLGLDIIDDSKNYFPEYTQNYSAAITTPEMAWKAIQELYPDIENNLFTCWTSYCGYYVFSFDCGIAKNKDKCSFPCIIYIPIGGNEFWYYVPRF